MEIFEKQFDQPSPEQPKNSKPKQETPLPAMVVENEETRKFREQQDQQKLKKLREQLGISEQKESENFFENLKRPYGESRVVRHKPRECCLKSGNGTLTVLA